MCKEQDRIGLLRVLVLGVQEYANRGLAGGPSARATSYGELNISYPTRRVDRGDVLEDSYKGILCRVADDILEEYRLRRLRVKERDSF